MPRWRMFYHLVWATRGREPLLDPEIRFQVHHDLRNLAQQYGIIVHAVGGIADHVHLAVSIPPALSVATAVSRLKGGSSFRANQRVGGGFAWQPEYGVTTFAERHLRQVVNYIENQALHHANGTLWMEVEFDGSPPVTSEQTGR